ncbi:hypothetical protein EJ05DRAFT_358750 [Pseudovirgaria hyperparasitica]|uniref:RING-type domain-containing protein n=1 Tax=Pseudovirgaria hyperparasitica TaxID=470096 RepID=A0A6A6W9A8_9PEZI|nr:uncharacterized protein EJ05DRAFT_358750 [Pseudovirgaria hyperparasitica]KAF2758604.1 hypothetical protein EJ05DRAFT_358750 [Pseudovirgaria hyperparasitica]
MTAQAVSFFTIAFPDPSLPTTESDQYDTLNSSVAFQFGFANNIRTLSTNNVPNTDGVKGLLYVPDLTTDECKNETSSLIPANATRRENLPDGNYILIGLAPWTRPQCVLEFLNGTSGSAIHGFIFYLPNNGTQIPPLPNDPVWGLNDGGQWKKNNRFPVWTIPGLYGATTMNQLGLYSGNLTQVPHGHQLADTYPPSEFIRLYTVIGIDKSNPLPSLWVFLLITLGLLLLIIGTTSLFMHVIQRKRRKLLRQRIVDGEVDLEALGVKRLTVPQEILDKMPIHAYKADVVSEPLNPSRETVLRQSSAESIAGCASSPTSLIIPNHAQSSLSQPTCAICLDDYIPEETLVRELPCRHIFHPECVDTFLLNNSSLCPMCKHSTLPRGYCPSVITNAMVRRERMVRRQRERAAANAANAAIPPPDGSVSRVHTGPSAAMRRALTGISGRRSLNASDTLGANGNMTTDHSANSHRSGRDIEMATSIPVPAPVLLNASSGTNDERPTHSAPPVHATYDEVCPVPSSAPPQSRSEWARGRAMHLLGRHSRVVDPDEEERHRGTIKRLWNRVFPSS